MREERERERGVPGFDMVFDYRVDILNEDLITFFLTSHLEITLPFFIGVHFSLTRETKR